jgi:hypothetical protein
MKYKIEKDNKSDANGKGKKVVKGIRDDVCISAYDVEYIKHKVET